MTPLGPGSLAWDASCAVHELVEPATSEVSVGREETLGCAARHMLLWSPSRTLCPSPPGCSNPSVFERAPYAKAAKSVQLRHDKPMGPRSGETHYNGW